MTVQINKTDNTFAGMAGKPLRQLLKVMDMVLGSVLGCQDNGIVSPDDSLRADLLGEFLKGWDDHIILAGNARFQVLAVGI